MGLIILVDIVSQQYITTMVSSGQGIGTKIAHQKPKTKGIVICESSENFRGTSCTTWTFQSAVPVLYSMRTARLVDVGSVALTSRLGSVAVSVFALFKREP